MMMNIYVNCTRTTISVSYTHLDVYKRQVTINKQRGMSNAFNISYGVDMTEIEEDVDLSDYCGDLYWVGKYTYDPLKNGEEVTAQYNGIVSFHRFNLPPLPVACLLYTSRCV